MGRERAARLDGAQLPRNDAFAWDGNGFTVDLVARSQLQRRTLFGGQITMLQKAPQQKNRCATDLTFTRSARVAWREILQREAAIRQRSIRVLLPAYIGETDREGSGLFDPIRQTQNEFAFYPVDRRLVPDVLAAEQLIEEGRIDLLLVVHYFGFVNVDLDRLRKQCTRHRVTLVEDCAHCCFLPNAVWGGAGDYSFYALHKFLPTDGGGILRANVEGEPFECAERESCPREALEQVCRTDLDLVARLRRTNYQYLEQALRRVSGVSPLWKLPAQTIPHSYPVRVTDDRREALYFHLLEKRLPTIALYYRLVEEIDPRSFPDSYSVANEILNLPVHQDTDESDLEVLVHEIEQFLDA